MHDVVTTNERILNALHAATQVPAECGNSLLKGDIQGAAPGQPCLWCIGAITAAALVLLHHRHDRIT